MEGGTMEVEVHGGTDTDRNGIERESEENLTSDVGLYNRPGSSSSVTLGVKDSDGFLTPPPASTLLIRRARTNSTGSSTYVASMQEPGTSASQFTSTSASTSNTSIDSLSSTLPLDIRKSFSVPYRRLHKRSSRDRRSEPYKRLSLTHNKVNVVVNPQQGTHVQVNIPSGNGIHRSNFPPISPLALDPSHALSVTLSSDRSISTVVPIDPSSTNPFVFPPSASVAHNAPTNGISNLRDDDKVRAFSRGKPTSFMPTESEVLAQTTTGKGMPSARKTSSGKQLKRKRGERGPDRYPNIDPSTGKRRYVRKKRFTLDRRSSYSTRRLHGRSSSAEGWRMTYDHELAGKWRPTDDLRLIINTQQINDLELVYRGVRFSCKFTLENIERRWAGLLYDKAISKVALNSMQNLHPRIVASIYENALFSAEEDRVLKGVRSTHDPKTVRPVMEKLLKDHALVFLKWRSVRILVEHWLHLREYHMLCDQNVQDYFNQESFSEFEDNLTEQVIRENHEMDPNVRRELQIENRHTKKMIRTLEEEVSRFQLLADMVTEIEQTPFEEGSFAILRGKQVRYLMRSREITLGRRTPTSLNVDADLSMEGSTYKVSRRQATIQLRTLGDFVILNQGKHAIYVDGNVVMPRKVGLIADQSIIEIAQLRFVFLINHKLVGEQRKKWIRLEVKKEMMRLSKIARFIKAHPAYPVGHPSHPLNPAGGSASDIVPPPSATISRSASATSAGFEPISSSSSNNATATIDSVASNTNLQSEGNSSGVESLSSGTTSRPTGSLTRPPQPPKYSATSTSNTTFIRSFVPPLPSATATAITPTLAGSSNLIPRITSVGPLFRKPAPPPPMPTIITQPSSSSVGQKMTKHVSIHSLRASTVNSPVTTVTGPTGVKDGSLVTGISTLPGSQSQHVPLPSPAPAYTSPFPPSDQMPPTVLISPSSTTALSFQGIAQSGVLADLTIRPANPPSSLNKSNS